MASRPAHLFLGIVAICGYLDVPGGITLAAPAILHGQMGVMMPLCPLPQETRDKLIKPLDGSYSVYTTGGAMPGALGDTMIDWLEMENPPFPSEAWLDCRQQSVGLLGGAA